MAAAADAPPPAANPFVAQSDVIWTTLGKNENDSMPIGNGDLAANVWTEANGDIVVLLAKSDSWAETGQLLKLGRIRIKFSSNPFVGAADFQQVLRIENGTIELASGENHIRIWADANHPVLHVEGHLAQPTTVEANAEFWRKKQTFRDGLTLTTEPKVLSGENQPRLGPDILFPAKGDQVIWCHYNAGSEVPFIERSEHLEDAIGKYPDPLRHRCFGAALAGPGMVRAGESSLRSGAPTRDVNLAVVALTQKESKSPAAWRAAMDSLLKSTRGENLASLRAAHERWWQQFWDRSWISVSGSDSGAQAVTQGYALQRYMIACSSRGDSPVKFNGGLFTVGHDRADAAPKPVAPPPPPPAGTPAAKPKKAMNTDHDPDYRAWGDCYWNQNNRLLFWPLIATGDIDLMQPWFDMYENALPLARERTRIYYHHAGAHFPETLYFWGLPSLGDFGKNNPSYQIQSHWQRYHVQGSLEVIAQMLDVYDETQDSKLARERIVPFADEIVTFYDQHYPRSSAGKITLAPAQSLETYQLVAINPTPDIAGLMDILPRLLALPAETTTPEQRAQWTRLLGELPPIPVGKTAHGKVPPLGVGDPDGRPTILPAEQYGKTGNSENPELYVAFPYRLYGVGKPDLKLAQDTFAARRSPADTCWGQDGPQSAILGLTDTAQKAAVAYFTNYGNQRFRWFWTPSHDWIPDLDNGGDGMLTLQFMLMQCDGRRIQLLPAWPKDWTADFRLHAPYQTVVEGHVEGGKISTLKVTPASRAADVVILP